MEKYDIEKAQAQAELLKKKISQREATDYTGAEKLVDEERKEELLYAKKMLEYGIKGSVDMLTSLDNINHKLGSLGMHDLAQRVYSELIPKATFLAAEKSMTYLDTDSPQLTNLLQFQNLFGHDVKKGAAIYNNNEGERERNPNNTFRLSALQFVVDVLVILRNFDAAQWDYRSMGNTEKAKEMKKLAESMTLEEKMGMNAYYEVHMPEIVVQIRQAYARFVEAVKDTTEYNIDYKKSCIEIRDKVNEEMVKLG